LPEIEILSIWVRSPEFPLKERKIPLLPEILKSGKIFISPESDEEVSREDVS